MSGSDSGWALISDFDSWKAYTRIFAAHQGVDAGKLIWGISPSDYPFLVATKRLPDDDRLISMYVMPKDARELLAFMQEQPVVARAEIVTDQQDAFNLSTLANIHAIVEFLIHNKLVTEKSYATLVARHLQKLEQKHQARKEGKTNAADDM